MYSSMVNKRVFTAVDSEILGTGRSVEGSGWSSTLLVLPTRNSIRTKASFCRTIRSLAMIAEINYQIDALARGEDQIRRAYRLREQALIAPISENGWPFESER